jgi:hypothetical protein
MTSVDLHTTLLSEGSVFLNPAQWIAPSPNFAEIFDIVPNVGNNPGSKIRCKFGSLFMSFPFYIGGVRKGYRKSEP